MRHRTHLIYVLYYICNTAMRPSRCILVLIAAATALTLGRPASASTPEQTHSAAAVQADLDQLLASIEQTHPDLGVVADRVVLRREAAAIRAGISRSLTTREAWLSLALLNPHFRDAHTGLRHPAAEFDSYREAGGASFPIPIFIDRAGSIRVAASVPPGSGVAPFETIRSINGRSSASIVAALMARMRGETESIRRLVLAFNFPAYLWTMSGPELEFSVEVIGGDGAVRIQRLARPDASPAPGGSPFAFTVPHRGVALLRVPSFDPQLRDSFAQFLEASFARIERDRLDTLLIDIRDNPGGAHDTSDLLISYLTDRPVSPASRLTARITANNRDISPQAVPGSVVTVPFDEPIAPRRQGRAYRGRVFVLISEDSYSQAIVFAATVRDHRLGSLVGETTGGAANQTGQITPMPLPQTSLQALAPLYIIYRPNGEVGREGLRPDIALPHDQARPESMVQCLLDQLESR
jgi:hypothetical protein